ncbi:hypothetical protein N752_12200 [Desulforamulus aquiferis]|nr:carbohydrate-binding domain-containing protein [Desulforamulus aquiferis]RYD04942.1 hypothetical protein N752_12200 [Desulforamulus aquiferis]
MHYRTGKLIPMLIAILFITLVIGCQTTSSAAIPSETMTVNEVAIIDPGYSNRDLEGTWDAETATSISLNGSSIAISGAGATASGGQLTISTAGVYVLSGTLDKGQIIVDAADSDKVQIVLNGVSITCPDSAPIYVKQADKVFLTLGEGTKNTITDGATYILADGEEEPDAAIFSKEDLTINGSGELIVKANYNNGITSKDDLIITGGDIIVNSARDGLRGRDMVAIYGGAFVINADGDGIKSNNDKDTDKGWVSIDGGTFEITAGNDGIQAETIAQITGGTITIKTGGGSAEASVARQNDMRPGWGKDQAEQTDASESTKGIKGKTAVYVTGGNINIDSKDDSLHSNGDICITAGTLILSAGDDGIHADASVVVNGGTIHITNSYEGVEGKTIVINGGEIHVTASDDGINAADGSTAPVFGGTTPEEF